MIMTWYMWVLFLLSFLCAVNDTIALVVFAWHRRSTGWHIFFVSLWWYIAISIALRSSYHV